MFRRFTDHSEVWKPLSFREDPAIRVTWIGAFCNLALVGMKLVGGIFGHSQALIADGFHSLSDLLTDFITLVGVRFSTKPQDSAHPYGHGKIETMAAFTVGLVLILTAIGVGYNAARSIYLHHESHPTLVTMAIAALSIVVKEILYRVTISIGRRERKPSVVANAWHHRSDALSSVAAFLGIGGAILIPSLHILDAFAALIVAVFIVRAGALIVWDGVKDLTDTAPSDEILTQMNAVASDVPEVLLVHNLKARYYAKELIVDLHAEVSNILTVAEGHKIAHKIKSALKDRFPEVLDVQVHIEPEGDTSLHPNH